MSLSSLPRLLEQQDRFEEKMGWNTEQHIEDEGRSVGHIWPFSELSDLDGREWTRQEELEFAAYRADQELQELHWAARQYEMFGRKRDEIRDDFAARREEPDRFWDATVRAGSWFQRNEFEVPTTEEYAALCGEDVREGLLREDVDWEQYADRVEGPADPDAYVELTEDLLDEHIAHEAVDTFLFLKKIGETLDHGIDTYMASVTGDWSDAGTEYERLTELLERNTGAGREHATMYAEGASCRSAVERLKQELYTEAVTERYGAEADRVNLYDNVFKEAFERREAGTYDSAIDWTIGETTAELMIGVVDVARSRDGEFTDHLAEKLAANRERMEEDEEFGVEAGYGEVGEYMVPAYRG